MIPVLLAGAVLGIGAMAVVACWDEIKDWLKNKLIPGLRRVFAGLATAVSHAAIMVGSMFRRAGEMIGAIAHKLYYKEDGKWIEKTTTREIPAEEVPDFIRYKIEGKKNVDITEEMEDELEMQLS